jgi:L-fuculose-phosphate aldolase
MTESELRRALVEASEAVDRKGLNSGTSGNISVRFGDGMLITPTGMSASQMSPELMVPMQLHGSWSGDVRPSSEWAIHAGIYRARPEAHAVVHAHPDHCVALSCAREGIPLFHYMVAGFGGDDIRCSAYATFGSPELADVVIEAIAGRTACLLANHGMVAFGKSLAEAVGRTEKLETLARQYVLCRSVAKPVLLTAEELVEVRERYKTYGVQPAKSA